jgi:hypothetical protein
MYVLVHPHPGPLPVGEGESATFCSSAISDDAFELRKHYSPSWLAKSSAA